MTPAAPTREVSAVYDSFPDATRSNLLELRRIILEVAATTPGVGSVEETLRWGQPSFVTAAGIGSTVRIDGRRNEQAGDYAVYFICSTQLVDQFRALFGDTFQFEGDRALVFGNEENLPQDQLRECIALALTYHLRK